MATKRKPKPFTNKPWKGIRGDKVYYVPVIHCSFEELTLDDLNDFVDQALELGVDFHTTVELSVPSSQLKKTDEVCLVAIGNKQIVRESEIVTSTTVYLNVNHLSIGKISDFICEAEDAGIPWTYKIEVEGDDDFFFPLEIAHGIRVEAPLEI